MPHKYKVAFWALLPLLLLVTALVVIRSRNRIEPMSPSAILKKDTWTKEELAFALARNFKHQSGKEGRKEVLQHLQKQLQKFPSQDQENIKVMAISQAIDDSIAQYRALKPDEKVKMVDALQKRAEKNSKNIDAMNSAQRQQLKSKMGSSEGQAATGALHNATYNKLTSEERRAFAPIEKIWLKTIEKL